MGFRKSCKLCKVSGMSDENKVRYVVVVNAEETFWIKDTTPNEDWEKDY